MWAGFLSIVVMGLFMFIAAMMDRTQSATVQNFEDFLQRATEVREAMIAPMLDIPFIVVTVGFAAVVGVITEIAQWLVAKVRNPNKGQDTNTTA